MPSDTQVIYSMVRVGRIHPPNKQVLRDISLGFYYGAMGLMFAALLASWWVKNSKFGLGLFAINMDIDAAETIGVNTVYYKNLALMLSAFMVGICGGGMAHVRLPDGTLLIADADGDPLTPTGSTDGTLDVTTASTDHICAVAVDASAKIVLCLFPD